MKVIKNQFITKLLKEISMLKIMNNIEYNVYLK